MVTSRAKHNEDCIIYDKWHSKTRCFCAADALLAFLRRWVIFLVSYMPLASGERARFFDDVELGIPGNMARGRYNARLGKVKN